MSSYSSKVLVLGMAALFSAATSVWAQQSQPLLTPLNQPAAKPADRLTQLEARLDRLERIFENQVLRELIQNSEQLQREVRELRGELESQYNQMQQMQQRQQDLYVDTDRRLRELEVGGVAPNMGSDTSGAAASDLDAVGADAANVAGVVPQTTNLPETGQVVVANPAQVAVGTEQDDQAEQQAYQRAFEFLKTGQYPQAIAAYEDFVKRYPSGRYIANAQYWLGEANYVSRAYDKALVQFRLVVEQYTNSPKVPDARLKIGFAYYEMALWDDARNALETVLKLFPGSSVARLADQRLVRMKQEGH